MTIKTLQDGSLFLYSEQDYVKVHLFGWHKTKSGYVAASRKVEGKWTLVYFHREIFNLKKNDGVIVDHIDGNPLNNRRDNLRLVTQSENLQNAAKRSNTSSSMKGVSFYKRDNKWSAQIHHKLFGKLHLGYFDTEIEAAQAYNRAAEIYFKVSKLNKESA